MRTRGGASGQKEEREMEKKLRDEKGSLRMIEWVVRE
jgi:hypothetical protein